MSIIRNEDAPPEASFQDITKANFCQESCICRSFVLGLDDDGTANQGTQLITHDGKNISTDIAIKVAERGCSFCAWILYPSRIDWAKTSECYLYFKYRRISDKSGVRRVEVTEIGFKKEDEEEAPKTRKRVCRFIVYDESDTDLPRVQVTAQEGLRQCKTWFDKCCSESQPASLASLLEEQFAPRRLIQIQRNDGKWKLNLVEDVSARYAALSYSWGGDQNIVSKSATVAQHKADIPFESLAKNMQDVIKVTFGLGLSYVWIDSFCILQDENDDRRREFLRQKDIYSKATVTIAASRATNHREGFLDDIVFNLQKNDTGTGRAYLWKLHSEGAEEPLYKRAWAFQEYLLSNRIIFFESYKLRWVCACNKNHWPDGRKGDLNTNEVALYQNPYLAPPETNEYKDGEPGMINKLNWPNVVESTQEWYDQLERFSHRDISKFVDKFPAMMGVLFCHYLFLGKPRVQSGMWIPDRFNMVTPASPIGLIAGFLWYTESKNTRKLYYPSWSWTSTDGHLNMSYCREFITLPADGFEVVRDAISLPPRNQTPGSRSRVVRRIYDRRAPLHPVFNTHGRPILVRSKSQAAYISKADGGKYTVELESDRLKVPSAKVLLDVDLWNLSGQRTDIGRSWQDVQNEREVGGIPSRLLTEAELPGSADIPTTLLRVYHDDAKGQMVGLITLKLNRGEGDSSINIRIGVFDFQRGADTDDEWKVWNTINDGFKNDGNDMELH